MAVRQDLTVDERAQARMLTSFNVLLMLSSFFQRIFHAAQGLHGISLEKGRSIS